MTSLAYVSAVAALLLVSGLCHLFAPGMTDRSMSDSRAVRGIGALLLLLAIPCLIWRGWYFWTLFAGLAASGSWRVCFPRNSIRMQRRLYPRRVHGLLLTGGAILVWALRP